MKIRILLIVSALLSLTLPISAQQDRIAIQNAANTAVKARVTALHTGGDSIAWTQGGSVNLGIAQGSYHNWAGGGENSAAGTVSLDWYINYKKRRVTWENLFSGAFGRIYKKTAFTKLEDRFEFNTKINYAISRKLFYSVASNLKSQFAPGYSYGKDTVRVSDFMVPGYLFVKIGLDYKPNSQISLLGAPFMGKATFVNSDLLALQKRYGMEIKKNEDGIEYGARKRYEWGGGATVTYKRRMAQNVNLDFRADFFSNYKEEPKNVDVEFSVRLDMPINQVMSTKVTFMGAYDNDVKIDKKSPKFQWMQSMNITFALNLKNPRDLIPTRLLSKRLREPYTPKVPAAK